MLQSYRDTTSLFSTDIVIVVDANDPKLEDYRKVMGDFLSMHSASGWLQPRSAPGLIVLGDWETGNLVKATNTAIKRLWWNTDSIVGHIGDDHRFRTIGWDKRVLETLETPGVAVPNDGTHHGNIPTACFLSMVIPKALGWLALPTCTHLYIDNAWRSIGEAMAAYRYMPDVLVEHLHPTVGKSEWDAGYRLNNSDIMFANDRAAWLAWQESGTMAEDMAKIGRAVYERGSD